MDTGLQKKTKMAEELAVKIDRFMEEVDPYNYKDAVEDRSANIQEIRDQLMDGETGAIREYLQTILDEQEGTRSDLVQARKLLEKMNELDLLTSDRNLFGIYQISEISDAGEYMFESKAYMERMGISLTRDKYDLVYVGAWTPDLDLEKIFTKFNIDRPEDFKGHSLSMSDVVLVHENGENRAYYVDIIGFAELPDFFGRQQEMEVAAGKIEPGSLREKLKERREQVERMKAEKLEKSGAKKEKITKKADTREP